MPDERPVATVVVFALAGAIALGGAALIFGAIAGAAGWLPAVKPLVKDASAGLAIRWVELGQAPEDSRLPASFLPTKTVTSLHVTQPVSWIFL